MGLNVAQMSNTDRLAEILNRSKDHFGPEGKQMVDSLLSPENLVIVIGTLMLWAGSHLFGVGEIVDILLLIIGAFTIGLSITDVAEDIYTFADLTINAKTEPELDKAAKAFSHAVILAGVTTIMALLLRRSVKQIQATRGANVLDAMRPRNPGLPRVPPDPQKGKLWSDLSNMKYDSTLQAGSGKTSPYGLIRISSHGSNAEKALALAHEIVHKFLTPRFAVLRTFRVQLRMSGYLRSALLKYLEEALAETYARFKVVGINWSQLKIGISFPIEEGWVLISNLQTEGAAIGTIFLGTENFVVQFVSGKPQTDLCYMEELVCR